MVRLNFHHLTGHYRLLGHAAAAADLGDPLAASELADGVDNLFVTATFAWHPGAPLASLRRPA